jgi:polyphosphate kinase 2 (PPK2 family)
MLSISKREQQQRFANVICFKKQRWKFQVLKIGETFSLRARN